MGELLLLLLVLAATGLAVAWPLLDGRAAGVAAPTPPAIDDEEVATRHRLALEALRDLEADRRAGSLDEESYRQQRAEAESRAVETLPPESAFTLPSATAPDPAGRRVALALGAALAALVLIGFALPEPVGIGERTVEDRPLADAIAAEEARQAEIARLQARIAADEDQARGAAALLVLINLEPENASAYRRLITAYINAGDWTDARSALDAYEEFAAADEADIPFFRGLIALRGDGDEEEAVLQFDRFLELAPHDPRAAMVLSLRERAAGSE